MSVCSVVVWKHQCATVERQGTQVDDYHAAITELFNVLYEDLLVQRPSSSSKSIFCCLFNPFGGSLIIVYIIIYIIYIIIYKFAKGARALYALDHCTV